MLNNADIPTVMLVDDTPENLKLLQGMLQFHGYRVLLFTRGRRALEAARRRPPDLILLDVTMPEMDGFEVCRRLKEEPQLREIPVLFISALSQTEDKVKAFAAGGVDYITKPFQFEEVQARVETHLKVRSLQKSLEEHNRHLEHLVQQKTQRIAESHLATIVTVAKLAESRDDVTGGHIERTRSYCRALAEILRPEDGDFAETIFHAAALHDVGKIGIPDSILLKPGALTQDEFAVMKSHTTIGAGTIQAAIAAYNGNSLLNVGLDIVRSHHERWDGAGYPDGLRSEEIPLAARIMAVADVYDALRSTRPYKSAFSHAESVEIIRAGSATQFSPEIVEAFLRVEQDLARIYQALMEGPQQ